MMTFPSHTVAPSIHTAFVNGVKFDVCEVAKEAYEMLEDTKCRYFLCVEDTHIVDYDVAEKFFASTGDSRWGLFCMRKAGCMALISRFEDAFNSIVSLSKKAEKKGFTVSCTQRIQKIKEQCIAVYGTYPID